MFQSNGYRKTATKQEAVVKHPHRRNPQLTFIPSSLSNYGFCFQLYYEGVRIGEMHSFFPRFKKEAAVYKVWLYTFDTPWYWDPSRSQYASTDRRHSDFKSREEAENYVKSYTRNKKEQIKKWITIKKLQQSS